MKAILVKSRKYILPNTAIVEIVIWQLPEKMKERPHGYKYRLNYCLSDGITIVRYDNKIGKGDHKHLYQDEFDYKFETIEKLLMDFKKDVVAQGGLL